MKLYELRRDETMRKARNWFIGEFHPESLAEYQAGLQGDKSAYVRMVTSYWDMAATFVNSGAVDRTMYMAVSGESMAAFSKVAPVLAELREAYDSPSYLVNWEKLIMGEKDAEERMKGLRASFRAAQDQKKIETADVG
jgi:hypothetical protein